MTSSPERPPRTAPARAGLQVIAAFKFAKSIGLVAAGFGALRLRDPARAATAQEWLASLSLGHHAGAWLAGDALTLLASGGTSNFGRLAAAAFAFAALYAVEGVGLALARRWAEYLTVIVGVSFLPAEIVALVRSVTVPRAAAFAVNVAVVWYLVARLRAARGVLPPA